MKLPIFDMMHSFLLLVPRHCGLDAHENQQQAGAAAAGPQRKRRRVSQPFLGARGAARSAAGKKLRAAPLRQAGQLQAMLLQMRKGRGRWCGRTRARTCATIGNNREAWIGDKARSYG
ncbi:hypothetical protein PMI04_002150 [Sphingobium sp. AP49]|uniref:hypothetical protein n=1 Tax=Sphingobium sp. AP49 TaxID=1144307 RepID=UPI0012F6C6E8|nr:hypothetical protein [Sphingobium sp. AP49]WHO39421.1 hypothetical protein PMI04_002150 [Sphingobium sp. AP49]